MNEHDPRTSIHAPASPEEAKTLPPSPAAEDTATGDDPSTLPRSFGRYSLLRQLGTGGMGTVYLAHDTALDRRVALKIPHSEVVASPQALERFYREARAAAQLDYPGICRVHDVGSFLSQPYITMAFIEGEPLSNCVGQFLGQSRRAAGLMREVALAVAEAHARGVIHRDLKPANIMLDTRGSPVIMDFGLARLQDGPDAGQTGPGVVMGTPAYMAPEQAGGEQTVVGPASDVYSLGVILYELLTGRPPFLGNFLQLLVQVAADPPPSPSTFRPDLDSVLETICLKALAKRPEDRFASASALASALEDYCAGRISTDLSLAPASPTQKVLDSVLRELRGRGWERGLERVRDWLPLEVDVPETARQTLLAWLVDDTGSLEGCRIRSRGHHN